MKESSPWLSLFVLAGCWFLCGSGFIPEDLHVSELMPPGSVNGVDDLSAVIDHALREAAGQGRRLVFDAGTYPILKLDKITIPSNVKVDATGAKFVTSPDFASTPPGEDGSLFRGVNVHNLDWTGGEFQGFRDSWYEGTNIRPILLQGASSDIVIRNATFRDFSAPGISVVGTVQEPAHNVELLDDAFIRDGAYYYDYLEKPPGGQAKDSSEMDKGQLLIHHADGVHLRGNTLRDGLSDGAFLRFDQHGVIEDNQFQRMKMGGLLINESSDMMVRNNVFHSDGSRNITIEWGSQRIDVLNNTVEGAGREGLWGWGYASGRVEGNTFTENGRKHDSSTSTELQLSPWKTGPAELYHSAVVVANNTFQAGMDEVSAISVPVGVDSIVIRDNKFAGPNRTIRTDWLYNGFGHVTVQHNEGWRTEESGHYSEPSTGDRTISFPHHLDILDPNNAEVVSNLHFTVSLKPLDPEALGPFAAIADARKVIVTFDAAPRKGSRIEFDWKVSAE